MPTVEVSEEQAEYLEALRDELAEEHVGEYGTVRVRDAIQFLIDRHEEAAPSEVLPESEEGSDRDGEGSTASDGADEGSTGEGSGANRLEAMMNLLETHDEKWAETDSEEGRYEVTLPDGETELVRTQDDVRALLFEHYR